MWVYRSGHLYQDRQIVLYEYQQTRNASHPREFLKGYDGICVTDGYQVYHTLEKELEELTIAGCWVHCRRRFDEALKLIPKSCQKESNAFLLMKQIQAIYREEGKLNDLSSDERLKQRQAVIKPLVDAFFAYLKTINVSKKDKFGDAVGYALNQEKYLRVFLTDGDVPIDNNASERAIRGFCIGKKNWRMIDTINGAKSSAIIYSIVETAKANNRSLLTMYSIFWKRFQNTQMTDYCFHKKSFLIFSSSFKILRYFLLHYKNHTNLLYLRYILTNIQG